MRTVRNLFEHGLTMESTISEMVDLLTQLKEEEHKELHITDVEGNVHHIAGQPHTDKAAEHAEDRIHHHMHKMAPDMFKSKQHAADANGEHEDDAGEGAFYSKSHSDDGPATHHHKSVEHFAKAMAKDHVEIHKMYHEEGFKASGKGDKSVLIEAAVQFLDEQSKDVKSPQQKEYEKRGHETMNHPLPKGHVMKHHKESDMWDQGYVGKHPDGHSNTSIDHQVTKTHDAIHAEVKKQNPHLSSETHKVIAKAIHASF